MFITKWWITMASNMYEILFHRTTLVIFSMIWFFATRFDKYLRQIRNHFPNFLAEYSKNIFNNIIKFISYYIICQFWWKFPCWRGFDKEDFHVHRHFTNRTQWFRLTSHFLRDFFRGPAGPALLEWIPYPPPALGVTEVFNKNAVPQQSSPLHLNKKGCSFWNHQKIGSLIPVLAVKSNCSLKEIKHIKAQYNLKDNTYTLCQLRVMRSWNKKWLLHQNQMSTSHLQ